MIGSVTMADILAMRRAGTFKLLEHPDRLGRIVRVEPNPFRQYCRLRGINGKGKKRFRKARKELQKAREAEASARLAQAEKQTSGGLIRESQAPRP